jgi:hypothetical protein
LSVLWMHRSMQGATDSWHSAPPTCVALSSKQANKQANPSKLLGHSPCDARRSVSVFEEEAI